MKKTPILFFFKAGKCWGMDPYEGDAEQNIKFYLALVTRGGARRRISICHGCRGSVNNPPINAHDEFVVVCRDRYRLHTENIRDNENYTEDNDRHTEGVPRKPPWKTRQLHFHMTVDCVRLRYPNFQLSTLRVPEKFLTPTHKQMLGRMLHLGDETV